MCLHLVRLQDETPDRMIKVHPCKEIDSVRPLPMTSISLEDLRRETARATQEAVRAAPSVNFEDYGEFSGFDRLVGKIEQTTETAFRIACLLARGEESVEATAEIWKQMVGVCDASLADLRSIAVNYRQCSGPATYDRVLDYRNEAHERYALHC